MSQSVDSIHTFDVCTLHRVRTWSEF